MNKIGFSESLLVRTFLVLWVLAVLLPGVGFGGVDVSKDILGNFAIRTAVYQAQVNGKTGMLERMLIGDAVAVEKMTIDAHQLGPFVKQTVSQEGPTKIIAYLDVKRQDRVIERALRISYEAAESTLYVKILAREGGNSGVVGRGPYFYLGKGVQMVRSLDFKETVPMPALKGRQPWPRVKFYYSNGATLGLLNQGAGNPFNPNENGGVGNYQYSRGGYVANSEYVYTLIAKRGKKPTLGAPPIHIVEANTPAVFWQYDRKRPVQATLRFRKEHYQKIAGRPGLRVKYRVQDAFEKQVAKGEAPLDFSQGTDTVEVKVRLPVRKLGWYRVYFTVNDRTNSLLEGEERLIFSVLKHQANMGERFANQVQTDYTIGLGLKRVSINPMRIDEVERRVKAHVEWAKGTDVNVSYQIDGSPVGRDPKRFGEVCFKLFERVQDSIPRIEIINEPNGTLQPKEYIELFLRPAYENIKKASPKTKVVGPVLCGISGDQVRYLDELYKLGLKELTDELSFHPYAGNFDDGSAPQTMRDLLQVIRNNGDQNKPIHFTEAGYGHGGWSNLRSMREIIKHAVSQYAWQNAVMGIDHRHNFYYFTDIMGYYDMWLRAMQLTPGAVALRTYTGFVKGQNRAQKLDFGSLEVVRAFLYRGPKRQVVVLWTACNWLPSGVPGPVTRVAFKTNTTKVTSYDCFGNPRPVSVKRRTLRLSVGSYPTYLVFPARAKFSPIRAQWGTNVALSRQGAIAESSSEQGTAPAVLAIDGNTAGGTSWRSLTPNVLPQSLTVTLAGPARINRVGIWGYSPRGYDLEAMGPAGKWRKLVSRRDQSYRRFRTDTFKPILTDQVRLTVVDSRTSRVEIAELQIFSPGAKVGGATELVNWALKKNGAAASASSEMRKQVRVAELAWGATKPKIIELTLAGKAENAIDGKRLIGNWRDFFPTTWMAAAGKPLPQWLEIAFDRPRKISAVTVYTIAFSSWTPADSGIRDWDVQLWDGKAWKTIDTVKDNVRVSRTSRLKRPTATEKIRIVVKDTNDAMGTVGIMEVEAYGPRK